MPSITVDGFRGLCQELRPFTFLVPDESGSPTPGSPDNANNSTSSQKADPHVYQRDRQDHEDPDKTRYIWSFTICGAYQATHFLGRGAKGLHIAFATLHAVVEAHHRYLSARVVRAFHTLTGSEVAAKIEAIPSVQGKRPFLEHEIAIYKMLRGSPPGIPTVHWAGHDGNFAVLIMDRLGANLGDLHRFCRGVFTLRTICMLADKMVSRAITLAPGERTYAADTPLL